MNYWIAPIVLLAGCVAMMGCSMCCGPHDFDYPTIGGKHQRVDPTRGRVGSRLSDPNVMVGPSADSNLEIPEFNNSSDVDSSFDEGSGSKDDDDSIRQLEERLEQLNPDGEGFEPVEGLEENPGFDESETSLPQIQSGRSARSQQARPLRRGGNRVWR